MTWLYRETICGAPYSKIKLDFIIIIKFVCYPFCFEVILFMKFIPSSESLWIVTWTAYKFNKIK